MHDPSLESRLAQIESRNQRVELDKAWETSWTRRLLLTLFTYLALGIYMWTIGISRPFLNSIVPAVGFMISTFTLPWLKQQWMERCSRHVK
ncbi:MAG: hypothetical protein NUV84_00835 [Candidatus Uhrbacteria bacterium]|nr:hypothetical protein [Candidatus Uhrbacteria bacterium]